MSALETWAVAYATTVGIQLFFAGILLAFRDAEPIHRKYGARLIILSPVAPAVIAVWLVNEMVKLFDLADFKNERIPK